MRFLLRNALILGIIAAIVLAWLAPPVPLLQHRLVSSLAVAVVFLIQGLSLSSREVRAGLNNVRLHAYIQVWSFLIWPLGVLAFLTTLAPDIPSDLRVGLFYLSILPTTISSSVAMVASEKGNVAAAVFNTALSNLAAIAIIPLWLAVNGASAQTSQLPLGQVFLKLLIMVFVPFLAGQLLRQSIPEPHRAKALRLRPANNLMICLVAYAAFSRSIESGLWESAGSPTLGAAAACAIGALLVASSLVTASAWTLFGDPADRACAFFCASQKSLASGLPIALIVFADQSHFNLGLIIIPILIYHPAQLFLGAAWPRLFPRFFSSKKEAEPAG